MMLIVRRMCLAYAIALWLLPAAAQPAPSAQVQTVPLERKTLTDTVLGYGAVAPATDSLRTLSLPRPGQVLQLWVSTGQSVRRGTALLEFGTAADASLAYEQAVQAVAFARGEAERVRALLEQQLATRSQLAATEQALADAQARLRQQQSLGSHNARETLRAPFDGVVVAIPAARGERLAAGAPLLQLAAAGREQVLVGVEPGDARRVRAGQTVAVQDTLGNARVITGRVTQVFGMIDPQTQLVNVQVSIPGDGLLPGTRVTASIAVGQQSAWVVPRLAVLRDAKGAYLFQVAQGRAHRVDVSTGLEQDGLLAVQGPLVPDRPVVGVGNYELHDGMAVRGGGR